MQYNFASGQAFSKNQVPKPSKTPLSTTAFGLSFCKANHTKYMCGDLIPPSLFSMGRLLVQLGKLS
jgi:hypothetical protein